MKAGRELDALIAEKVMGWEFHANAGWYEPGMWETNTACRAAPCGVRGWRPSTRIQDAWQVVEKLMEKGWSCNIIYHDPGDCLCEFWGGKYGNKHWREIVNHQPSIPLAICLAALKAVE